MTSTENQKTMVLGVTLDLAVELGQRLRLQRTNVGKSLEIISKKIKIREYYLQAIEEGRWGELPPGLNGRGLVRLYAKELGVSLLELEPKNKPQQTHPQYQPVGEISVISRAAYSEKLAKSNNNLHETPRMPVVSDYRSRQTVSLRHVAEGQWPERSPSEKTKLVGQMNSAEDESLLDVVTPDVASILGLSEKDLLPQSQAAQADIVAVSAEPASSRESAEFVRLENGIPVVSANDIVADFFADPPKSVPLSQIFPDAPPTKQLQTDFEKDFEKDLEDKQEEVCFGESETESRKNSLEFTENTLVSGNNQHSLSQDLAMVEDTAAQIARDAKFDEKVIPKASSRPVFLYLGMAATLVAVGAYFFGKTENAPHPLNDFRAANAPVNDMSASESAARMADGNAKIEGSSAAQDGSNSNKGLQPEAQALVGSGTSSSPLPAAGLSVPMAQSAETHAVVKNPAVDAKDPVVDAKNPEVDAKGPVVDAKDPVVDVQGPAMEVKNPAVQATPVAALARENVEVSKIASAAPGQVQLEILGDVEIQLTVDGKRIMSGIQKPGKLQVEFKSRAELFVGDGSLVKLKYAGWDHGVLGHQGRKRRILLNASPYDKQ